MEDRQIFFFCDANTAIYDTHLFRKRGGLQVIRLLRAMRAQIALPDISRAEYLSNFAKVAASAHSSAQVSLSTLHTLCGHSLAGILPPERFWESQVQQILDDLKDIIFEIPCTSELKAAALDRAVQGRRPAAKPNQDVKDCLIWECILSLPAGSEVIFASRDLKAFFNDGKFDEALRKEAEAQNLVITAIDTSPDNLFKAVDLLKGRVADVESLRLDELTLDERQISEGGIGDVGPIVEAVLPDLLDGTPVDETVEMDGVRTLADSVRSVKAQFELLEGRAFGVVSYLRRTSKPQVMNLLVQAGSSADAARNVLERLTLAGMIRDTGNNYLAVDSRDAQLAARLVEDEMIKLTGLGG